MSPYQRQQIEKRRKSLYRKWHRRIGFAAALFLLNLSITGILLNHSDDLELHQHYIQSQWLVELFGIKAPEKMACSVNQSKTNEICQIGNKIYSNNQLLTENSAQMITVLSIEDLNYLITSTAIFIYTQDEQLVEVLSLTTGLPTPISKAFIHKNLTQNDDNLALVINANDSSYSLNLDNMTWSLIDDSRLEPISKTLLSYESINKIDSSKRNHLVNHYLTRQITYLKFIQDLHSGQIFGLSGKIATDLVGFIVILLAITGFITWKRRKTNLS